MLPPTLEQFRPIMAGALEQSLKMVWAPAIANGAAVLAAAQIIGNAPHPDAALRALTPTLALFALGLLAGVGVIEYAASTLIQVGATLAIAEEAEIASGAAKYAGEEAERAADGGDAAAARRLLDVAEDRQARFVTAHQRLTEALASRKPHAHVAAFLNRLSMGLLAAGFTWLLVGHHLGWLALESAGPR